MRGIFICGALILSVHLSARAQGKPNCFYIGTQEKAFSEVLKKVRAVKTIQPDGCFATGEFSQLADELMQYSAVEDFKKMLEDREPIVRAMALYCPSKKLSDDEFSIIAESIGADFGRIVYRGALGVKTITVAQFAQKVKNKRFSPYSF